MKRFTESLRSSVAHGDWYVALATALTLPDVCGRLIDPTAKSGARYAAWFDEWMSLKHKLKLMILYKDCFLSGSDCYALRCSYLHEGGGDISDRQKRALDNFHFIVPPSNNNSVHMNKFNETLQVQVDVFCFDMACSVDEWSASVANNADVQSRMLSLLKIHNWAPGIAY